jgi:AmmeMemoRadiSam system protein B
MARRRTREPAVAGTFYPARRDELQATVAGLLDAAAPAGRSGPPSETPPKTAPKAVIAPHAGFIYSGPVAASAFAQLSAGRGRVRRVVLLGPSHFVPFRGLATSGAGAFATPLGSLEIDREAEAELRSTLRSVQELPAAHGREHCLEVELPFLQHILGDFEIVPLVVGDAADADVSRALDLLWGGDDTLIVVSSDLSHYLDYASARRVDAATSGAIERLRGEAIGPDQACGAIAIRGLLEVAERRGLAAATLDLRNSGDTAGPRDAVVGYGAWNLSSQSAEKGSVSALCEE